VIEGDVEIDFTDIRLIAAGDVLIFTSDRPHPFANREKTGPVRFVRNVEF
jgi:hypothetical protein